jgi:predicted transcriptional regulator
VELVRQEAQTKVMDMMGPVEELLKEDDTLNWAIYAMFRADVREPLVVRKGKVVGVLNLMVITRALLEVIGPQ